MSTGKPSVTNHSNNLLLKNANNINRNRSIEVKGESVKDVPGSRVNPNNAINARSPISNIKEKTLKASKTTEMTKDKNTNEETINFIHVP